MRGTKQRLLSLLLVLVMVLGLLPGTAWAVGDHSVKVTFQASSSVNGFYVPRKEMTLEPGIAARYGYFNGTDVSDNEVTILDALVQAHVDKYGTDFTNLTPEQREEFLKVSSSGFVEVAFRDTNADYSIQLVNGGPLGDTTVATAVLQTGDVVENIYPYVDTENYYYGMDIYTYFAYRGSPVTELTIPANTDLTLTLMGDTAYSRVYSDYYGPYEPEALDGTEANVFPVLENGTLGESLNITIGSDGGVTFNLTTGDYDFTVQGMDETETMYCLPWLTLHVVDGIGDQTLQNAKANLTWETIRQNNLRMNEILSDLSLPDSYAGVDITWQHTDVTGALSIYGTSGTAYVNRPAAQDVSCTLTATLSYNGNQVTKEFPLTIKAEGVSEDKATVVNYGTLMRGIAANYADDNGGGWSVTSAIDSNDLAWAVMDMQAYGKSLGAEINDYNTALSDNQSTAKFMLAEYALGHHITALVTSEADVWSAPSILMARYAAGTTARSDNSSLIATMVDYLNGTYLDTDTVAMVLPALAPYREEMEVSAAIDKGVSWLSGKQNADGTFPDYNGVSVAESTAQVIVALSALGIDAHTDSRFVKDYKSAVEGLLTFALKDNSGFGHKGNVTYNAMATEQGFRALVAYARFKESGSAYNIYLQAKNSSAVVTAPNITATVKPPEGGGSTGEVNNPGNVPAVNYQITVSVMVPPEGGEEGQYTYRYNSGQYSNLLGSAQQVSVDQGTTALAVLTSVLDDADISYTASASGYVSEIGGLEEKDHGPNSGWQYMVNGTAPNESAGTYTFDGNARMIWYYTDDYTKEKSSDSWSVEKLPTAPGDAQVTENTDGTYTVTLPEDSDGPVRVVIPNVKDGQIVVIVGKDGSEKVVKKSVVRNGSAYLLLEADATVRVVDRANAFGDVAANDWYAAAVDFVTGRGLFSGVTEDEFAPNMTLNRGMLVTVLYALEEPGKLTGKGNFYDVSPDVWYAQGVTWATQAGIVSGFGDGLFGPEEPITREQLALMLYQYAKIQGLSTGANTSLIVFRDQGDVSSWAREAVTWAVDAGIISGRPDGTLDPAGTATRAEAAVMLRQLVTLMTQA